jgi:hypothetical protein
MEEMEMDKRIILLVYILVFLLAIGMYGVAFAQDGDEVVGEEAVVAEETIVVEETIAVEETVASTEEPAVAEETDIADSPDATKDVGTKTSTGEWPGNGSSKPPSLPPPAITKVGWAS